MLFKYGIALLLSLILASLPGCTAGAPGSQANKKIQQDSPIERRYQIVVVEPVAISSDLASRYPQAARTCQRQAIKTLKARQSFRLVHHSSPKQPDAPVLLVKSRITDMRLRSSDGKAPAGASASPCSYVNLDVHLVDGASQTVLLEKHLTAIPSADGRQKAEPDPVRAIGQMLAEYVLGVMPKK